jgi:hypothetical protein
VNLPLPRLSPVFDAALGCAEQALVQINAALAVGQTDALDAACNALQQALAAVTRPDPQCQRALRADKRLQQRVQAVRMGLTQVRDNLARRAVPVQRALDTLMPGSGASTYGRNPMAMGRNSKTAASFTSFSA